MPFRILAQSRPEFREEPDSMPSWMSSTASAFGAYDESQGDLEAQQNSEMTPLISCRSATEAVGYLTYGKRNESQNDPEAQQKSEKTSIPASENIRKHADCVTCVCHGLGDTRKGTDRADWVYEGNGYWTHEYGDGREWHGWAPAAQMEPIMAFDCLRDLYNPDDSTKAAKACAKVILAVNRHRKLDNCGCDIAWLGGRDIRTGIYKGAGKRDRPAKLLRCSRGWFAIGSSAVASAMREHDRYCRCHCFGANLK